MSPSHNIGKLLVHSSSILCFIYAHSADSQGMKNYDLLVICIWYSHNNFNSWVATRLWSNMSLPFYMIPHQTFSRVWDFGIILVLFSRTLQVLLALVVANLLTFFYCHMHNEALKYYQIFNQLVPFLTASTANFDFYLLPNCSNLPIHCLKISSES